MKIVRLATLLLLSLVSTATAVDAASLRVVVSIAPIHSLAAAIMEGTDQPKLLLRGGGSPHSSVLRPSDIKALQHADLIVWVGPLMEQFLAKALKAAGPDSTTLTLIQIPGLILHPVREGGVWPDQHADEHHAGSNDQHIWLNPQNAIRIAIAIRDQLVAIDPLRAGLYRQNCAELITRLQALDRSLEQQLQNVRSVAYIVFHDAYQTLEARYGLHAVGAVAIDPERRPGVRRLEQIRDYLRQSQAACLFSEPQFEPRYIKPLTEGTSTRIGVLDPLGSTLTPGPQLYFELMQRLADSLVDCLDPAGAPTDR